VIFFVFLSDFGTVPTVWYFRTVPTVWYFRTVRQCGILELSNQYIFCPLIHHDANAA
jgi:hypothetical protein